MMNVKLLYIFSFLLCVIQAIEAQVFFKVDRMPFNTQSSEMAPAFYNGGLVFSSDRKNDIILVTVDQSGNFLYNLYFSDQKNSKNWLKPLLFPEGIISRYNQSAASFSADGKTIFYTSTQANNDKFGDRIGSDTLKNGIYFASRNGSGWGSLAPFPFNNESYDVAHPFLSPNGSRLFFSSRNPEGFGNYDIYYSDRLNGRWSNPKNIGSVINTKESEVFPYLFNENRLYFASGGHDGHGGLDLYYSDFINGEWKQPVNLPEPFNSENDDFAFISNADMDTGYFTTNRGGNDDIYRFVSTFPTFTKCPEQIEEDYCYEFYEAGTINLDTTSLKYEWDLGDGQKIREVRVQHCYKDAGYYLVQLNVIDTLTGEISFNQATYDLQIERAEQPYILMADTASVSEKISFDGSKSNVKAFTMQNYYWDFGDGSVGTDLKMDHSYLQAGKYIVRLGITGTDGSNNTAVLKACSQKQITIIDQNK